MKRCGWAVAVLAAVLCGHQASAQPVEVQDASTASYEAATDTWSLEGSPVRVRRGPLVVEAQVVRYRARQGTFEASGGVRVVWADDLEARADRASGSLRDQQVELEGAVRASYRAGQDVVQLSAPKVVVDFGRRVVHAQGGVRGSWQELVVTAQEVVWDGRAEQAVASGDPVVTWQGARLRTAVLRADLRAQVLRGDGGVHLEHPQGEADAHRVEVRWPERVAVLRGGVVVRRGADQLRSDEVRYQWERGVLVAAGRSRVVVYP